MVLCEGPMGVGRAGGLATWLSGSTLICMHLCVLCGCMCVQAQSSLCENWPLEYKVPMQIPHAVAGRWNSGDAGVCLWAAHGAVWWHSMPCGCCELWLRSTLQCRLVCNWFPAPDGGLPVSTWLGTIQMSRSRVDALSNYIMIIVTFYHYY